MFETTICPPFVWHADNVVFETTNQISFKNALQLVATHPAPTKSASFDPTLETPENQSLGRWTPFLRMAQVNKDMYYIYTCICIIKWRERERYIYISVNLLTCVRAWVHACIYVCRYVRAYVFMIIYVCIYICVCTYIYMCICIDRCTAWKSSSHHPCSVLWIAVHGFTRPERSKTSQV